MYIINSEPPIGLPIGPIEPPIGIPIGHIEPPIGLRCDRRQYP